MRKLFEMPRLAQIAISSECIFGFGTATTLLLLNFHASQCGFSDALIGTLLSFGYLVAALTSFICGRMADRYGFSYVMRFGNFCQGTGLIIVAMSHTASRIFAGYALYSVGYACAMAMEYNLPLSFVKPEQMLYGYNLVLIFYYIGSITANFVGGRLSDAFRFMSNPYATLLLCGGALFYILTLIRSRLPNRKCPGVKNDYTNVSIYSRAFQDRDLRSYLLFGFITMALFTMASGMLNLVLRYRYMTSDTNVGSIYSASYVAGFLVLFFLPIAIQRVSLYRISTVVMLVQLAAIICMIYCGQVVFAVMMVTRQACCTILYTSADGAMLKSVAEDMKGTYSGLRVCANNIGMSVASAVSGLVVANRNFVLLFVICTTLSFLQNIVYHVLCSKGVQKIN